MTSIANSAFFLLQCCLQICPDIHMWRCSPAPAIPEPANTVIVSWCALSRDDLARSLSLYKHSELGRSGARCPHLKLLMPGVAPTRRTVRSG